MPEPEGRQMTRNLVLASASPRRMELLRQIGIDFHVLPVDLDESMQRGETVLEHAKRLAIEKARLGYAQVSAQGDDPVVLAADTVVEIDGDLLGKPRDNRQAAAFLSRLSGETHKVHTAIAVVSGNSELTGISSSEVEFTELSVQQIAAYVETGEPMDKAGAYAIQGIAAQFIVNLNGSYSGVMGLPLYETAKLLAASGIHTGI